MNPGEKVPLAGATGSVNKVTMKTTIELGLMCDPISRQLKGLILSDDAKHLDLDNAAINRCIIKGYLGQAAAAAARKRLLRNCQAAARRFAEAFNRMPPNAHASATGCQEGQQ